MNPPATKNGPVDVTRLRLSLGQVGVVFALLAAPIGTGSVAIWRLGAVEAKVDSVSTLERKIDRLLRLSDSLITRSDLRSHTVAQQVRDSALDVHVRWLDGMAHSHAPWATTK